MGMQSVKGYVQAVFGGLLVAALGVLVALQWGNHAQVTMYGPVMSVNTALLMLCSGAGGLVLIGGALALFRGIAGIRRSRRRAAPQASGPEAESPKA